MTTAPARKISPILSVRDRTLYTLITTIIIQSIAALYFIADGVDDVLGELRSGLSFESAMECFVAFALCAGIVFGSRLVLEMSANLRRQQAALDVARGALAAHIAERFAEWSLSAGECDVALFALKGCSVAEIARMRNAASGTVRSQLSQVYAKAGVNSQSMLVSLFIEDLLEADVGVHVEEQPPKSVLAHGGKAKV